MSIVLPSCAFVAVCTCQPLLTLGNKNHVCFLPENEVTVRHLRGFDPYSLLEWRRY